MKKVSVIAAAVAATLAAGSAFAEDKVQQGWQVNGYGHLLYNVGQSLALNESYEHRRDYRAAGAPFSGNPNQVEFTVTRGDNYENGSWSKYVLKTEYGNNEGGNGRGFYGSSSGNEGHLETGQLEFKEAYVELGDLSYFKEGTSVWAGKRYLNRQAGIITKEFWKQSSGVGGGIQYNDMGLAVVSADSGEGSCLNSSSTGDDYNCKNTGLDDQQRSTTITSVDFYYYGVEALGGRFDFDAKLMTRANVDSANTAEDGFGLSVTYSRDYYGFDGWSLTALAYGQGVAANRGVNFGQWSGNWQKDDESIFLTSYGVANVTDKLQLGTEVTYWDLSNDETNQVWGSQDGVSRLIVGATPSYKVNENFRMEATFTYAIESLGSDGTWGREKADTSFYTATLAPVMTVNADYWGRPQIKPYVSFMSSSDSGYKWSNGGDDSETRVGVEAEIWF
ncbi:carbohydrate porin [Vibrio coralliilyticus]|uniref:carbohydrate porin n=1 Tax=Vibrio coralliilyticus TaxID=190893 RepID=UPI0015603498|nr:carbohydrate porin [Vibrio coralliilyticus]NRF25401.1 carbohydrate porin [Vibrio coralliilyticus]NRF79537.1 carbohydrate porin [Vibrio coralliilyticus]